MPLLLASSSDLSAAMSLSAVYGFGHLAKDCRRWSASTMMMGASLPRHSAYDAPIASQQASLGGVEVVAVGLVGALGDGDDVDGKGLDQRTPARERQLIKRVYHLLLLPPISRTLLLSLVVPMSSICSMWSYARARGLPLGLMKGPCLVLVIE